MLTTFNSVKSFSFTFYVVFIQKV